MTARAFLAMALLLSTSMATFAQKAVKSKSFTSPDLQVFELKGHVKSVTFNGAMMNCYGLITFAPDGSVTSSKCNLVRDSKGRIEEIQSAEYVTKGKGAYGNLGRPIDRCKWVSNTLQGIFLDTSNLYEYYAYMGLDGALSSIKLTGGSNASEAGGVGKTYTIKYMSKDKYGNWTSRISNYVANKEIDSHRTTQYETRVITYYEFEDEYYELVKGGSLDEIEEYIATIKNANEPDLYNAAVKLWNDRSITMLANAGNLTEFAEKITKNPIMTSGTKSKVLMKCDQLYREKLYQANDPTVIAEEINSSSLATKELKSAARSHWNTTIAKKVETADNQLEEASKYIDNDLIDDKTEDKLLTLAHNYVLENNIENNNDYKQLYRNVLRKCGTKYVFSPQEQEAITSKADKLKYDHVNGLLDNVEQDLNNGNFAEAKNIAQQASAITPDFNRAVLLRAEAEYQVLWQRIINYTATANDVRQYINDNPTSKYNADLELVALLLDHYYHQKNYCRKIYDKMVKKNIKPKANSVTKAASKCAKKGCLPMA